MKTVGIIPLGWEKHYPSNGEKNIDQLIKEADDALYWLKRAA
jgi:hypothetical protein